MTLVLRYSARSDRGLVRQNNQDSVYAGPRLLALADGMGGHAAGEVASKLVISALVPLDDDEPGDDLLDELRAATEAGNAAITDLVAKQPDLEGMGTTLTAILFAGNRLGMVHVGDSRAYLLRDGQFSQITKDDTFVQSLIDEGRISPDDAHTHPQRSLLLRALTGHELEPSLTVREARAGDRYLLCSDGLSAVVSAETLAETLRMTDPRECANHLIELALRGGGPDNITCIVADVVDIDFGEDAPIVGGAAGDGTDPPPPDSAAARAAVTTLPRVLPRPIEPMAEVAAPPPRRRGRIVLAVAAGAAVLVFLGMMAQLWMSEYYVGAEGDRLAIFQGVRGSVLGIPLQRRIEGSCGGQLPSCTETLVTDLKETARNQVYDGIFSTKGLEGARDIMGRLRTAELLPQCPDASPPQPQPQPRPPAPNPAEPNAQPESVPLPPAQLEPGKTCHPAHPAG
ncbi:MAG: serine/threonine-protein phosphatase [Pseudonocardia sp.]|nr:serine/threonine-protein phosphatase [Pseudonocardia sp.]